MNFEGTYVAMVTPFTDDGNIDEIVTDKDGCQCAILII